MVATAASSRPRFRTDLVAEPIDEDGQRYIDVIDPDNGNAFRFYEVEYSIACAMDGERDVRGLADWAREELGITPSSDEIANVVATLGDLGYLEAAGRPMFGDDLVQKGVVAPPPVPVRAPAVELGAGGLTAGWNVPTTAERAAVSGDDLELGRAGGRVTATGPALESMDVGLGAAGAAAPAGEVIEFDAPTPPPYNDEPQASLRRTTSVDDEEGPTHLPQPHAGDFDDDEVSVDLSEHLAIRPDDVKEAVRASQVMKAVDVPPELLAQLGEREQQIAHAAEAAKATARAAQNTPVPSPQRNTPVVPMEAQPEFAPFGETRQPVELPQPIAVGKSKPVRVADAARAADVAARLAEATKGPVEAPERPGTSPVLIVLLIIVILGAGAFFVWKYVLDKPKPAAPPDNTSQTGSGSASGTASASGTGTTPGSGTATAKGSGSGTATAKGSGAGTATTAGSGSGTATTAGSGAGTAAGSGAGTAVAPPAPTGTLHAVGAGPADLKALQAGTISVTTPAGTKVNAGDVVVRLMASPRTEDKVQDIDNDLAHRYPAEIKRAQEQAAMARTQGNEALAKQYDDKVAERQHRVQERTAERQKYADELSKLEVKAAAAGTVKKASLKGAAVNAGDTVATIDGGGGLTGTIDVGDGASYKPGDTVKVASTKATDQQVDCTVSAVDGTKVTIACAADSGWADGTTITIVK
jgi:hypothetical protein